MKCKCKTEPCFLLFLSTPLENEVHHIEFLTSIPVCQVPFCNDHAPGAVKLDCSTAVGYMAVYRVCFIATLFFSLMALLMINVKSSKDGRAGVQNGSGPGDELVVSDGVW